MIDIHNHILINIDDGPKDKDEMISLLRQAKDEGVDGIVATPHHLHPSFSNTMTVVKEKINELMSYEEVRDLGIKIYAGQEIRVSDQILTQLETGEIEGINQSKYLLLELPSNRIPRFTKNLIFELQTKGYVPIIVHPERNKEIAQDLDKLFDLVNAGALSQVTSGSLMGEYGKRVRNISIQMIENDLVHFIASDAHHKDIRPFRMNQLLENKKLSKHTQTIQALFDNAEAIIANEDIHKRQPSQDYRVKKFLGIF